jgi:bidirectional [NiFe] hydrogenase diaphorase subunit
MKIVIDGREIEAEPEATILEAAQAAGIFIPTLCHHPAFGGQGHCRMCMVEVEPPLRLVASCTHPVFDGMVVRTTSPTLEEIRKNLVMLLYRRAPASELMGRLKADYLGADQLWIKDPLGSCILCRQCVNACQSLGLSAISASLRGTQKRVTTPYDEPSPDCIGCATCAHICPTGAIPVREENGRRFIWHKSFELVHCPRCGEAFATREQLQYAAAKTPELEESQLCDRCRRLEAARHWGELPL